MPQYFKQELFFRLLSFYTPEQKGSKRDKTHIHNKPRIRSFSTFYARQTIVRSAIFWDFTQRGIVILTTIVLLVP